MSKTLHVHYTVRGLIKQNRRELGRMRKYFSIDGKGPPATVDALLDLLMDKLAAGEEVIPIGSPCDNFDPKHGCLGHEVEAAA